jgi:hypothetical protein
MQNKSTVPFANQNNARNQVKKTLSDRSKKILGKIKTLSLSVSGLQCFSREFQFFFVNFNFNNDIKNIFLKSLG